MQKIPIELDDIQMAQLSEFARLNNLSIEEAAARVLASSLREAVDRALDDVLTDDRYH